LRFCRYTLVLTVVCIVAVAISMFSGLLTLVQLPLLVIVYITIVQQIQVIMFHRTAAVHCSLNLQTLLYPPPLSSR
jgi:hypothetical protein